MSYGEDKMKFTVREGVTVISQEMEFCGKVINVEVRISETYGFVRTVLTDNATGQDIDLDMQLTCESLDEENMEVELTSNDECFIKIDKDGIHERM